MRTKLPKRSILVPANATMVFKGVMYDIYHWQQQMFDGSMATYEMLKRPDTVKVIAVKDDKLVVLEQEQSHEPPHYDLPGGQHDNATEDELQAMQRELLEETGLSFNTWRLINIYQPNTKIEQFVYMYIATDFAREQPQKLDAGEKITVRYLPFDQAKQALTSEKARYNPREIEKVSSLQELLATPEYDFVAVSA